MVSLVASASAEQFPANLSRSRLAEMGLGGLRPISEAAGDQIRGNRTIFGNFDAVGIPLDAAGSARLVALLYWSYRPGVPHVPTILLRPPRETRDSPEALPRAPREF